MRPPAFTLLILAALAIAGCSGGRGSRDRTARDRGGPVVVPVSAAQLNERLRASGARATLLNVWATWCAPCREEFPAMLEVARRHPELRVVLVSTDFDEQLPEVRRFLARHGVADTSYLKRGGDQEFIDTLDPAWSGALPATLVYDASGRRVAFWEGAAGPERFESAITKALHPNLSPGDTP